MVRWTWWALIPFFEEHMRYMTASHLWSGTLESSKTVPTVVLNCLRHPRSQHLISHVVLCARFTGDAVGTLGTARGTHWTIRP